MALYRPASSRAVTPHATSRKSSIPSPRRNGSHCPLDVHPISPARVNTSAPSAQAYDASTAIELAPSSADMPRRTPPAIARWNGQAHHSATGVASARHTHCQPANWSSVK